MDRGSTTVCILMDVDKEVNPIWTGGGKYRFPMQIHFPWKDAYQTVEIKGLIRLGLSKP